MAVKTKPVARATSEPPRTAEVLAVQRDQDELLTVKQKIMEFLDNLKPFFAKATEIERDASDFAGSVKLIKPPTNGEEDAAIVRMLQVGKEKKEKATLHWSLRKLFYAVNQRMLDAEKRPVLLLDTANATLQRHHTAWKEADDRRVREEQRRIDDAAKLEEQRRRDAEVARMEEDARSREEAVPDLSARETLFVELYVTDQRDSGNGPECSKRAGFTADPFQSAARLLALPKIQQAIQAKQAAIAIRRQAEAKRAEPVTVPANTPVVERDLFKVGRDTVRWGGDVVDPDAFFDACGIPEEIVIRTATGPIRINRSVFEINGPAINTLGKELKERLDHIPGLRHRKTTSTT